ncbi:MAG: peptidylprolyl isomerase, partial [Oscillospiraceae bacterium]|nr:peptidylprolyl isomerase [Oscillospiraceae bacterium]
MKKFLPLLLIISVLFTACGGTLPGSEKLNVSSDEIQFAKPAAGDTVAEIITDKGVIKAVLFPEIAPKAVASFTHLANGGYFDGITFHRAVEGMLIQTGSFDGSATGGKSAWELEFEDEFSDLLHHYNGALSMANHGEDTNGSQFFFVTTPIGSLEDSTLQQMTDAGWRAEVQDAYKQAGGLPNLD